MSRRRAAIISDLEKVLFNEEQFRRECLISATKHAYDNPTRRRELMQLVNKHTLAIEAIGGAINELIKPR